jgi:membrane-associated phospholipid phosphatase
VEAILNIGITWNIFIQNLGSWLKTPMEAFSFLGSEYFFLILLPALYWCLETSVGLRVGVILLLSTSVNDALKLALHGPRPYWMSTDVIGYASETSFGAPSGHAQIAVGVWGMMAASLKKWWGWLIAILIIFLIGISRLYLGVHFPHDVILGWVIGGIMLWLVAHFWKPGTNWIKKMSLGQQILTGFMGSLVLILFSLVPYLWLKSTNWQPPAEWASYATQAVSLEGILVSTGTLFGFLAGLAWFSLQGGFSTEGPVWKRVLRFLLGAVGILIFYVGLDVLFGFIAPGGEAFFPFVLRYIRYTLVGAWVSAGAPWVFVKLNLADRAP